MATPPARGGQALPVTYGKSSSGNPKPGSAGWKSFTEARWKSNHPYAGVSGLDPKTGQPVMKSQHQIRAEANADAWKSIAAMQKALPSEASINAPFDQQRASIAPLIAAHRSWLESVGAYQTNFASKMGALTGTAGQESDQANQGAAASAGGSPGMLPQSNVTPAQLAGSVSEPGGYFGEYLRSLVPSATAQGIGNIGTVNAAQDAALRDLTDKRAAIAAQLPELQATNFKSGYELALDEYKSELAALEAGHKSDQAAAAFKETVRYHTGLMGAAEDRNKIADKRASKAVTDSGFTAGDSSGLTKALAAADLIMHPKPTAGTTKKVPSRYAVMYEIPARNDPLLGNTPAVPHSFSGPTVADVKRQLNAFMKKNGSKGYVPVKTGNGIIHPVPGETRSVTTGGAAAGDQYQLRQQAWNKLVALNSALVHPVSREQLLTAFRRMEGQPK